MKTVIFSICILFLFSCNSTPDVMEELAPAPVAPTSAAPPALPITSGCTWTSPDGTFKVVLEEYSDTMMNAVEPAIPGVRFIIRATGEGIANIERIGTRQPTELLAQAYTVKTEDHVSYRPVRTHPTWAWNYFYRQGVTPPFLRIDYATSYNSAEEWAENRQTTVEILMEDGTKHRFVFNGACDFISREPDTEGDGV